MLICQNCFTFINSKKHQNNCSTVNMYQLVKKDFPLKKPMMTYGLCGCSSLILIDKYYNRVIFGHHPFKNEVLKWIFENYYSSFENEYTLILKIPGRYCKDINGKYVIKGDDEEYWKGNLGNLKNLKMVIEPYNLNTLTGDKYNSNLYFKMINENLFYTNNYGLWIKV